MQVRGRYLVIAWTAVFLAAMGAIVLRDGAGFAARKRVDALEREIAVLDGKRVGLEAHIKQLSSRSSLAAFVAPLGLRSATDSEMSGITLPVGP